MVHSVASNGSLVFAALGHELRMYDANGTQMASWDAAPSFVEQLGLATAAGEQYLIGIVPGDKSIVVWATQPELKVMSRRAFPKRPSAWTVAEDQLVVGDKQGEVWSMPLLATEENEPMVDSQGNATHEPILGHVSVLLALAFHPSGALISADRDERIRVSRWPDVFVIDLFLLRHSQYVAHLALVGDDWLVSGGGGHTVVCWNWRTGAIVGEHRLSGADVTAIIANPDSNTVTVSIHDSPKLWLLRVPDLEVVDEYDVGAPVRATDGRWAALDAGIVTVDPSARAQIDTGVSDSVPVWNPVVFKKTTNTSSE